MGVSGWNLFWHSTLLHFAANRHGNPSESELSLVSSREGSISWSILSYLGYTPSNLLSSIPGQTLHCNSDTVFTKAKTKLMYISWRMLMIFNNICVSLMYYRMLIRIFIIVSLTSAISKSIRRGAIVVRLD